MTVRALLVNVLMTNNFSHSIFLHHPRGQRGYDDTLLNTTC